MDVTIAGPILFEWLVEKPDQRRHLTKYAKHARVEPRSRGEFRRKLASREKLPVLQVLGGFMIPREAARDAQQPFALEAAVEPLECRCLDDRAEPPEVRRYLLAYRVQLRRFRRVHPAADPGTLGRHVKVEAGPHALRELPMPEARGDMGLVRLLVFREPRVAIDAVDRMLRADEQLGRDRAHVLRQPLHDGNHGLAYDLVVLVAPRVEPLAAVVPLEPREKRKRGRAEAWRRCRHGYRAGCACCTCCAWKRAIRACCSRVRCGTMPIIRSMIINCARWCISCSLAASSMSNRVRVGGSACG